MLSLIVNESVLGFLNCDFGFIFRPRRLLACEDWHALSMRSLKITELDPLVTNLLAASSPYLCSAVLAIRVVVSSVSGDIDTNSLIETAPGLLMLAGLQEDCLSIV